MLRRLGCCANKIAAPPLYLCCVLPVRSGRAALCVDTRASRCQAVRACVRLPTTVVSHTACSVVGGVELELAG